MLLRRLTFALPLALMMALAAPPSLAAGRPATAWQGRFRAVRQERAQGWRQRRQARRQAFKANRAANRRAQGNRGFQAGGQFHRPGNGGAARPADQRHFQRNGYVLGRFPPRVLERFRSMSPEQQERFLENNRRFQSLPPQKQAQVRRALQRWNNLSPAQRDELIHRNQVWQRMSPEQRQFYRNQILPKWQQLPPGRRQLVIGRLHTLQDMTPAQRDAALNDPRFMQGLTPDEQNVLRNLNSLRNPNPR